MPEDTPSIEIHPALRRLAHVNEPVVEIPGYVGHIENERVRIYLTLNTSRYIDVSREDIVHVENPKDNESDPSRFFIRESATVRIVTVSTLRVSELKRAACHCPPAAKGNRLRIKNEMGDCIEDCFLDSIGCMDEFPPDFPKGLARILCDLAFMSCGQGCRDKFPPQF